MRILAISDQECSALWDYYTPGKLDGYDLILSCGDLKANYLSFLVTMGRCPLFYVHGNHDESYKQRPPEGCICIDDQLIVYNGLRILGLGGCRKYRAGSHQYTEKQMRKRIRKLKKAIKVAGGVDIVVCHAAPRGIGDAEDPAHLGFEALLPFLEQYQPQYLLHGHIHRNYGNTFQRSLSYGDTTVMNCWERIVLECEPAITSSLPFWSRLLSNLTLYL